MRAARVEARRSAAIRKRITFTDVSARAGVSRSTVSLVINGHSSIPEATRTRVLDAMSELGYVYNRTAASLRTRRATSVALIATEVGNSYFAQMVTSLEDRLGPSDIAVVVGYSRDDAEREKQLLRAFIENGVDGVILLPAWQSDLSSVTAMAAAAQTPLITIARSNTPTDEAPSVTTDNLLAGELLGRHLGDLGATNVAFVGGRADGSTAADRYAGVSTGLPKGARIRHFETPVTSRGGALGTDAALAELAMPQAIVALSDTVAVGVFAALRNQGLEPGRDIAVASFDNTPDAEYQVPALTSVATFPDRIAERCADRLLAHIDGSSVAAGSELVEPRLSVRESTSAWSASGG